MSNLLTFDASSEPSRHFAAPFVKGAVVSDNAWFDSAPATRLPAARHPERLYSLSQYAGVGRQQRPPSVVDYTLETIASVEDAPLATVEKARFLVGIYLRLNDTCTWSLYKYADLRVRLQAHGLTLRFLAGDLQPHQRLASRSIFTLSRADLRYAGPGRMYMAHLMLPHYPYSYHGGRPDTPPWRRLALPRRSHQGASPQRHRRPEPTATSSIWNRSDSPGTNWLRPSRSCEKSASGTTR